MSYRCSICGIKVPPSKPRLVHQVFKRGTRQITRELPVCGDCHMMLDEVPLRDVKDPYYLRPKQGKTSVEVLVEQAPAYNPPPPASEIGQRVRTVTL